MPTRRGFLKGALGAAACAVLPGLPRVFKRGPTEIVAPLGIGRNLVLDNFGIQATSVRAAIEALEKLPPLKGHWPMAPKQLPGLDIMIDDKVYATTQQPHRVDWSYEDDDDG